VIARADPARFFFAMIGEAHWESFGAHEARLRAFYADPPENVLVHASYIGDERDYNSVIATCDVLYAVYQDFNSSSNVLGKASGLCRRVLVAGDSLMGQRVLASRIGGVAPQGDPDAILQALARLHQAPEESFDFDHYSELHSLEALKKALADALPHWCDAAAPGSVDPARR
jgi:hypothetical protein